MINVIKEMKETYGLHNSYVINYVINCINQLELTNDEEILVYMSFSLEDVSREIDYTNNEELFNNIWNAIEKIRVKIAAF